MKRTICALAAAGALTLAGCSADPEPASEPAATAPVAATEAPAAPQPEAPAVEPDADLGSLPAGQAEACADMLPFFASGQSTDAELGGDGWDPDTAAEQIIESMSQSPDWNNASDDQRAEITAGIRQAAAGSCD